MVRLKGLSGGPITSTGTDFNSCMVRLKVSERLLMYSVGEFQFLYGSIKSVNLLASVFSPYYFNSCMVRLKDTIIH